MVGKKLKTIKQGWRKVWPFLLGAIFAAVSIWSLICLPDMHVPKDAYWLDTKTIFDIKNEARRTIAYLIGGVLAVIGIILTFRRIRALEQQVQIAQEEQITERFTRAIEQLGSDKMEVRLGGIYALERIANDSDKDYWQIMEILTAYVRENAPWRELPIVSPESVPREDPSPPEIKPATDIQAVLTVLGRRKYRYGQKIEIWRLDLRNTDLSGASLRSAHLEGSILRGAHLEEAHLEKTHLREAYLEGANLEGTKLLKTDLKGANLRRAIGLTREQLAEAIIDEQTKLPDYLKEQPPKEKGREGIKVPKQSLGEK